MRVGVVGGGITGLALTHHLSGRGIDAVAFEAREEPGGVIHTTRRDGRVLEHGPQRTRLTGPIRELICDLDIADEVLQADESLPLYVYSGGRLRRVPFGPREFLTTDLLSLRGKLRVLAEPLTASGRPEETAADLFRRKFGDEAYENLFGPVFGGTYGSDPSEMPARHALSPLLAFEEREGGLLIPAIRRMRSSDRPPAASFEDGMQRLPRALYEAHRDRVRLGTPVEALVEDGDGFRLETGEETTAVDRVVLTTPADATADLLSEMAPEDADRLRGLTYNRLAVVHLHADADVEGFGYQVCEGEGLHTLGVSWNASIFGRDGGSASGASGASSRPTGRDGVYTCFLGGMRDSGVLERPDDELGEVAAREFAAVAGADADVLDVTRLDPGVPAWDRSWDALSDLSLPDGVDLATNYTARMGLPGRVRQAEELAERLAGDP